jgi:hypothetical protein
MSRVATDSETPALEHEPRRGSLGAALWALAGAVCTSGAWALALVVAHSLIGVTFFSSDLVPRAVEVALFGAALGAVYGFGAGAAVACGGWRNGRRGGTLVAGGTLFGALGGGTSVLAVAATSAHVHPLVSSSLAWAVVGMLAGWSGYHWSRWLALSAEEAEEKDAIPPKRIEWVLRERTRRGPSRSLLRVLPVLVVSVAALLGAAFVAPSDAWLALVAVGVLGLSVALVQYRQEERLRALERSFRGGRD